MKIKVSKYKINDTEYQCECGRIFNYFQSINGHFSHCKVHRISIGKNPIIGTHIVPKGVMQGWQNKSKEEINDIYDKIRNTLNSKYESGELIGSFTGKHHTQEYKKRQRLLAIDRITKMKGGLRPNYNKNACKYFDKLSKENNWNLQHAENGGEYCVCGYYLDAYDKDKNIVVEYDECKHYKNGKLKERDIERQNNIINELKCDFYRYDERNNKLYKVN